MPTRPMLTQPFRVEKDGTRVTVGDAIIEFLTAGNYLETAAAACGVNRTALLRVIARGAQALRAQAEATKPGRPLVPIPKADKIYADFANRVATATALSEARDVATLNMLANGGYEVREITIDYVLSTNEAGEQIRTEVGRKEHTRTLAPSARAAMWRLERRRPEHWGRPGSLAPLDDTGAPLPSREERIANLLAAADGYAEDYLTGYEDGQAAATEAVT